MDADGLKFLPERKFADMIQGAIKGCMEAEAGAIKIAQESVGRGNGKASILHIPGQQPVVMNAPTEAEMRAAHLGVLRLALQGIRILLVALNDLDTRLRLKETPDATRRPEVVQETAGEGLGPPPAPRENQ